MAKPFLKWAGGKTQLIGDIEKALPKDIKNGEFVYIEPFVGSGAIMFWMLSKFSNIKKVVINDINEDLINTYKTIASNPNELISILEILQNEFHSLEWDAKKIYYNSKRKLYNARKEVLSVQAALFIFLNRTCFNGLYRVNSKNEFNVPMGGYKRPTICNREDILSVSEALQKVEFLCGDFEKTLCYTKEKSLFYFDPPYKPLDDTPRFNSYTREGFDNEEQIRLRDFCKRIDAEGHRWILSNSDVRCVDINNNFFDEIYSDFIISRVKARRNINSNGNKRGEINELLIKNYSF